MSLLQSIFMGILQGLTEFLPVSSSGHLALFRIMFDVNTDTGLLFETMLHIGTLAAVCIVFWKDIWNLILAVLHIIADIAVNLVTFFSSFRAASKPKYRRIINSAYKKFVILIIVTTIPTAIIGLLLSSWVEKASETLLVPGICLVITAIVLLVADMIPGGSKKVKKATYPDAAVIGVAQGLATLPGLSRSGMTISACLLMGFDRSFAVRYSFIASIPAVIGANILELRHITEVTASGGNIGFYVIGMVIAGVVGYFCIRLMMYVVRSNKFQYFAYYCAVIGIIAIAAYFIRG